MDGLVRNMELRKSIDGLGLDASLRNKSMAALALAERFIGAAIWLLGLVGLGQRNVDIAPRLKHQ